MIYSLGIWEVIVNLIESIFIVIFIEDKLQPKTFKMNSSVVFLLKAIYIFSDSIITDIINYFKIRYEISYAIGLFIVILFTLLFYNDSIAKKIFYSSIYISILMVSDSFATLFINLFLKIPIDESMIGGDFRFLITLIYISSISSLVLITHFIKWKKITESIWNTILFISVSAMGIFFVQYIVSITVQSFYLFGDKDFTEKLIISSTFFCVLFIILLIYIYVLSYTKDYNNKLYEEKQQLLLEESEYKNLIKSTEALRKLKHDMQHHLTFIKFLSKEKNNDLLIDYIDKYISQIDEIHKFVSTGNPAIDCILSRYLILADDYGIPVSYSLSIPSTFTIDLVQLSSLLGNLWTNAITASKKLIDTNSEKKPFIIFFIRPLENMVLISIENAYDGLTQKTGNGKYYSLKNDRYAGIGLKRINEIVDNNDGLIEINDENYIFSVKIIFPITDTEVSIENNNS